MLGNPSLHPMLLEAALLDRPPPRVGPRLSSPLTARPARWAAQTLVEYVLNRYSASAVNCIFKQFRPRSQGRSQIASYCARCRVRFNERHEGDSVLRRRSQ